MNDPRKEEFDFARATYEPLTQSVRRLIDTTIRTDVDENTVAKARALIEEATRLLSGELVAGSFGIRQSDDGRMMPWGNVAIGLRNPVAPPLVIQRNRDGSVWFEADLGAAYEGPPGCVHGGVSALALDQLLGATAHRPGAPAFTGTLTVRYLRPVPFGRIRGTAKVERDEGVKAFATGRLTVGGEVAVVAEGIFIRPRMRP
ncbi:PaaI family thioesterase [Nocardia rhamnosiphila]|uniref:PaaI family thioesterase n=1 Tax=Nocardia rhamnosiphila TaxID=426716 RepID=UPI00340A8827